MNEKVVNYGQEFPDDITKIGQYYSNIGPELYDEHMEFINFNAEPYNIAPAVKNILKLPTDARILDMGCGTGLITKLISKDGYNNISGVDATPPFVEAAIATGLYKSVDCLYLGSGNFPEKLTNEFDAVVASGIWLKGHCPPDAFDDVHAAMKVGGFFLTAMRTKYWKNGEEMGYKDKLDTLTSSGKF